MKICALLVATIAFAQTPPVILEIDMENAVNYADNVADPLKRGTSPAVTPLPPEYTSIFKTNVQVADIVSVNGQPAKGLWVARWGPRLVAATEVIPGRAIADIGGGCPMDIHFIILRPDGTPVGAIMATGTSSGPLPGAPSGATNFNLAVVGGTGAFLGVRGQTSRVSFAGRSASMLEDPAYRRLNGGGKQRYAIHLIPMGRPEVVQTAAGPAVTHQDGKLVSTANPAQAGEVLTLYATGLGPTTPGVDLGQPFTKDKVHTVIAPVEVLVNGKPASVLFAGGYPDAVDAYQVNFRLPDDLNSGTPGLRTAGVQVTAAWIPGSEVRIATK